MLGITIDNHTNESMEFSDTNSPSTSIVNPISNHHKQQVSVKKRRTKNFKLREEMLKTRSLLITKLPPFEPLTFRDWDAFISMWTSYMDRTKTLYRRRSSCSTEVWNLKNRYKGFPVPSSFKYATMAYWCTHGCIQPSRGTGVRAHLHNRFTGCSARLTAEVVYELQDNGAPRWYIRVRNQISEHNHRINDQIHSCYTSNASIPDELLLGSSDIMNVGTFNSENTEDFSSESRLVENSTISSAEISMKDMQHMRSSIRGDNVSQQRLDMINSVIQPIIDQLCQTPHTVIHKRLQDVSDVVNHLTTKWIQDGITEQAITSSVLEGSNLVSSVSAIRNTGQQSENNNRPN